MDSSFLPPQTENLPNTVQDDLDSKGDKNNEKTGRLCTDDS